MGLSPNPHKKAVHMRMEKEPNLWRSRPLDSQLKKYAASDVKNLLAAKAKLSSKLGEQGSAAVLRLSKAAVVSFLDINDQGILGGTRGSYLAAVKVPLGVDLRLTFKQGTYRPHFSVSTTDKDSNNDNFSSESSANASGHDGILSLMSSSSLCPSPNRSSPREDPDLARMLELFPRAIQIEILDLCEPIISRPDDNGTDSGSQGIPANLKETDVGGSNTTFRWPLEIVVDIGRPVTVRFKDDDVDLRTPMTVEEGLRLLAKAKRSTRSSEFEADTPSPEPSKSYEAMAAAAFSALRTNHNRSTTWAKIAPLQGSPAAMALQKQHFHTQNDNGNQQNQIASPVPTLQDLFAVYSKEVHTTSVSKDGRHLFHSDNRTGIPETLHRISAMQNRKGAVVGLTYRIGRHLEGSSRIITDVLAILAGTGHRSTSSTIREDSIGGSGIHGESKADGPALKGSLLLLGPPGVGKTTLLRDISRCLSVEFRQRVVIVDSSNEIGGDGEVPHRGVGRARRMEVPVKQLQHEKMREAVQNHM